ncbi:MAG TPA: hypothetical protein VFN74_11205 [Chloroflexota bacterium]|nr:hypothetical protein [Chloroflexota bacterium]
MRYLGLFAGYVRVPGVFVPTMSALDYEVSVAGLVEGRLFLPARITPAYVAVHDPTARFWSGPTPDAIDLGPATPALGRLLVVAPQVLDRIYVFSPTTNNYAWLDAPHLGPA